MAGTNASGLRSRSSHRISANISGVISFSFIFHVKADWNQDFRLSGVLMDHCWVVVIKAQWEGSLLVAAQSAAVDGGGAGHRVQVVGAVGQRRNPLTVPLRLLFPEVGGGLCADGNSFVFLIISFKD